MQSKAKKPVASTAPEPRNLTIKQAAHYLNATPWYVRTLAWDKKVPHLRLGARILFDRADLDRFIEQQKVSAR